MRKLPLGVDTGLFEMVAASAILERKGDDGSRRIPKGNAG